MSKRDDETLTAVAMRLKLRGADERRLASQGGPAAALATLEADEAEVTARALLKPTKPPTVQGGEVTHADDASELSWEVSNTLRDPTQVAIDASAHRTGLLFEVGQQLVAPAVDTAESAGASNSVEKMLTHQLAIIHELSMKAAKLALRFERASDSPFPSAPVQAPIVEFSRLSNTAGRLHSHFCEGVLTLQRLKQGGVRQTVEVRQVNVSAGGQAVIGNVRPRRALARQRKGKGRSKK